MSRLDLQNTVRNYYTNENLSENDWISNIEMRDMINYTGSAKEFNVAIKDMFDRKRKMYDNKKCLFYHCKTKENNGKKLMCHRIIRDKKRSEYFSLYLTNKWDLILSSNRRLIPCGFFNKDNFNKDKKYIFTTIVPNEVSTIPTWIKIQKDYKPSQPELFIGDDCDDDDVEIDINDQISECETRIYIFPSDFYQLDNAQKEYTNEELLSDDVDIVTRLKINDYGITYEKVKLKQLELSEKEQKKRYSVSDTIPFSYALNLLIKEEDKKRGFLRIEKIKEQKDEDDNEEEMTEEQAFRELDIAVQKVSELLESKKELSKTTNSYKKLNKRDLLDVAKYSYNIVDDDLDRLSRIELIALCTKECIDKHKKELTV